MGKLDSMIKCAQAKNLLSEKQFSEALQVVEEIDTEKVKSIIDLKTIGQVYMDTKHFQEAREVYFHIYDKVQSRSVLYHLIYLSIQCGLLEEAEDFYEEYKKLDHETVDVKILNYYITKAKGASHQEQMDAIKEILAYDYLEEWAYELAKLYHKEGMEQECVDECSKIILWFGEGVIVEKAMLLKLHYVDGLDISSPKAIEETRNLAVELRLAAEIADRQEREQYEQDMEVSDEQNIREESVDFDDVEPDYSQKQTDVFENLDDFADNFSDDVADNFGDEADNFEDEAEDAMDSEIEPIQAEEVPADTFHSMEENHQENDVATADLKEEHSPIEGVKEVDLSQTNQVAAQQLSKKQEMIQNIVEEAKKTKQMPHFVIVGSDEERIMDITKSMMRELCNQQVLSTPRIARISAQKANSINLEDKKTQLDGACLLIEGAHDLSIPSLQSLCQMMKRSMTNVVVGFVDDEPSIQILMNKNRKLKTLIRYELYV